MSASSIGKLTSGLFGLDLGLSSKPSGSIVSYDAFDLPA